MHVHDSRKVPGRRERCSYRTAPSARAVIYRRTVCERDLSSCAKRETLNGAADNNLDRFLLSRAKARGRESGGIKSEARI